MNLYLFAMWQNLCLLLFYHYYRYCYCLDATKWNGKWLHLPRTLPDIPAFCIHIPRLEIHFVYKHCVSGNCSEHTHFRVDFCKEWVNSLNMCRLEALQFESSIIFVACRDLNNKLFIFRSCKVANFRHLWSLWQGNWFVLHNSNSYIEHSTEYDWP